MQVMKTVGSQSSAPGQGRYQFLPETPIGSGDQVRRVHFNDKVVGGASTTIDLTGIHEVEGLTQARLIQSLEAMTEADFAALEGGALAAQKRAADATVDPNLARDLKARRILDWVTVLGLPALAIPPVGILMIAGGTVGKPIAAATFGSFDWRRDLISPRFALEFLRMAVPFWQTGQKKRALASAERQRSDAASAAASGRAAFNERLAGQLRQAGAADNGSDSEAADGQSVDKT